MLEAERDFRRVIGFQDLAKLVLAIEHDIARPSAPTQEAANLVTA